MAGDGVGGIITGVGGIPAGAGAIVTTHTGKPFASRLVRASVASMTRSIPLQRPALEAPVGSIGATPEPASVLRPASLVIDASQRLARVVFEGQPSGIGEPSARCRRALPLE
jgi:hypothetical protein